MAATNPQRPGMPSRQSTGRMSQTGARRTSLTGNPAIDGTVVQPAVLTDHKRRPSIDQNRRPSLSNGAPTGPTQNTPKGHYRRPSGNIGSTPGSRNVSRRGSLASQTIEYRYIGMLTGRCVYYQDGVTFVADILLSNGKTSTRESADLGRIRVKEGNLLFENPMDGKLYDGCALAPAYSFRWAGIYKSLSSFQNEGAGGTVTLVDRKGEAKANVPFYSHIGKATACFQSGQLSEVSKGDHIWYNINTELYYSANWVMRNPGSL